MTKEQSSKRPFELEALPEDFDPMEMAAFLEGESNTKLVKGLTESSALRAVAAAGLDGSMQAEVGAAAALAERAAPLARRVGERHATRADAGWLGRLTGWLGADWRGATAGVVLGAFGFGAGLAGGLGLGDIGVSSDDILIYTSGSEVFAFDATASDSNLYATDSFEAVFGSIQ
jgi:hypothetical protein